jgi:hypothetical protein
MKMKGALLSLTEAVRLARLELACYQDPDCRGTPEWTLKRLAELLGDKSVDAAMAAIDPDAESPSIVPHHEERDRVH